MSEVKLTVRFYSLKTSFRVVARMDISIQTNLFVCVEVLRPRQPNGVMLSTVSLPNHTFTGQA